MRADTKAVLGILLLTRHGQALIPLLQEQVQGGRLKCLEIDGERI
ncbi:MAG: hypothetical protein K0R67_3134 [Paenibacillus sp.]|jgi:hypothetical protein|nr:hypothetical protein [Paenibacillus sp.]